MERLWEVTSFGSCRIQTPLLIEKKSNNILFFLDSAIGYLHNPLEIAQAIHILRNEIVVPPELHRSLNITNPKLLGNEDRFAAKYASCDVIICELSSVRIIEYKDFSLQIHRLRELVLPNGITEKQFSALFESQVSRHAILESINKSSASDLAIDIIRAGRFYEISGDNLVNSVRNVVALCGNKPIIFVGTVTHDSQGKGISQRINLAEAMTRVSQEISFVRFWDPTYLVEKFGYNTAMKDLGHYNVDFEPVVAKELGSYIKEVCEEIYAR